MENLNQYWEKVKQKMFLDMTQVHYNTWIKPLVPLKKLDDIVYVYSTSKFTIQIVNAKYKSSIERILFELYNTPIKLEILEVNSDLYKKIQSGENLKNGYTMKLPIEDVMKNTTQNTPQSYNYRGTLDKKLTFENFVRGKSNELALAVALNVSENPGTIYNPFYIYGKSGLGKTHLMQSIGHKILENSPEKKVIYVTSETFVNEFIATITDSKNSVINSKKFREKYRECDVLMIDDIQFISGKESTQEEIFHTFNALYEAKKQIIFTSDKKPEEIKGLEERLVTRFNGGMIADIQDPDLETRVAIIQHKIQSERYEVPDNVISFIAENVTSNIRNLEGAILKVMMRYNLYKNTEGTIDEDRFLEIAKIALAVEEKEKKEITLELIKEIVAKYYNLQPEDFVKPNRQKSVSEPRQIAMHLSRRLTNLSLVKIASSFERDHATVIHGYDKVKSLMELDPQIKREVDEIIKLIKE